MKLLIGLGNPGKKFLLNRHNVGHLFVDQINSIKSINLIKSIKTDCFMNESGGYVKWAMGNQQCTIKELFVVHDDLDLPLGKYKIQLGVGPKVHNGVNNIEEVLGTTDFWRIRIGVDNRTHSVEAPRAKGDKYVLEDFTKEELVILKGVFGAILKDHSFPS